MSDTENSPNAVNDEVIIGIDLGTTNSLVGVVDSGFPIILADANGDRLTPSVVSYADPENPRVGKEALRAAQTAAAVTIASAKRYLGRPFSDLNDEEKSAPPFRVVALSDGGIGFKILNDTVVTPVDVSSEILRHLKEIAEAALELKVNRAVITVPAYFNNSQREATKSAAVKAGLSVERIINEPTAAALAYGLDKLDDEQTVAVYDLGGGTFDLSVLQMRGGLFEVISTAGDTQLGGDDFDTALALFVAEQHDLKDLSSEETTQLMAEARKAKESLSSADNYSLRLPFFRDGKSYESEITREQFESVADVFIDRSGSICRRAFAEAELKGVGSVDHLILVGGSTRVPRVQEQLEAWFGHEPNLSQHPDEAVALGAAIQAGMLCGRVRSIVLVDVTPLSLGIETFGGLMNVIIARNSTIPAKAGEMFTNAVANQPSMAIRVLQGEREMAKDNWLLGEIEVPFSPGAKGSARVGVQFAIDRDGILEVLARDTVTGEDHVLEIRNSAIDVDDAEVEKMVSESVDYAFDDMNARVWTEAKLKSEELLPAVEMAMAQVGGQLDDSDKADIESAAANVRSLLDSGDSNAAALKAANQSLDEATQTLAALLVEAAFEDV
ncbi:MAG: Hsp70 family protein [Verrucomicrobiales bacterium]|nr:Hsp70 family protein [Verrucomicrobiales bacterium]